MGDYTDFLKQKTVVFENGGFDVDNQELNSMMFDFQKDIVRWAVKKGKSAIFADCGMGKTLMQLEWSWIIHKKTNGNILILAPLSVTSQTKKEGERFGYHVHICESQEDVQPGINITNYEKLDKFECSKFEAVVLDESSILKSFTGKIRNQIIEYFSRTSFKLACTATPAPNDFMELGNHSEFLGVMTRGEMLSMYFVHDGGQTSKWRLKRHAESIFWEWVASWAVFIDNPANLGYQVSGYDLPPLRLHQIIVDAEKPTTETLTLTERRKARKESLELRCQKAAELVNSNDQQWLVWCDLNSESHRLWELCVDSWEIKGSDKPSYKTETMLDFTNDMIKCLITKPSIAGFGMNWQQCHNMIFVGLSDSYEQYYQALRRCWRFGQTHQVEVYLIISAKEGCVKENIERKDQDNRKMQSAMLELTKEITKKELRKTCRLLSPYEANIIMTLPKWEEFENENLRPAN